MKLSIKKRKGGYAILFTVVVVGIISMISLGLLNTAYKQIILSSVAKDSTTAFYEADIGSDCALYADDSNFLDTTPSGSDWNCGGHSLIYTKSIISPLSTRYTFSPQEESSTDKCFRIEITKTEDIASSSVQTVIFSRGYNICDKNHMRTVERTLRINY
jgi:hypothetical protein